jgi:hypothetical protein
LHQAEKITFALQIMESNHQHDDPTPPDCFRLEEVEAFKKFAGQRLVEVNYYFWNHPGATEKRQRMLYFLELLFDSDDALILTSGQDSEAIRVTSALELIEEARVLQQQAGGEAVMQRLPAHASAYWKAFHEQPLAGVRLSKQENGLYHNDALLLDFDAAGGLIVALHPSGGLAFEQRKAG